MTYSIFKYINKDLTKIAQTQNLIFLESMEIINTLNENKI